MTCLPATGTSVRRQLAARIVKRAAPSEPLVSAAVVNTLGGSTTCGFTARGVAHLAGIREPEELFTLEWVGER